jgi:HK97 family phage major capsid protein
MSEPTLLEVKSTLENIGKDWHEFKKTLTEKVDTEIKGLGVGEIKQRLAKIDESLTELETIKKSIERTQTALNRKSFVRVDQDGNIVGDVPEDHAEVKAAYRSFLRKGVLNPADRNAREMKEFDWDKKSMSVISDADGGYTVTSDMSGQIVRRIYETSPVRDVASIQTIGSDALEGTVDQDQAAYGWVAETGVRSSTGTPQLGVWRIPTHELYAMPAATQKLLDDSNIDIEAWLAEKVSERFGRVENTAFVLGTGVGQPTGFMTYPTTATIPNTPQGYVEQVTSLSSGTMVFKDLITLVYTLKQAYRTNAQWGMHRQTISYTRQLLDGFNRPLWEPSLQIGEPSRLLGYPVNEFDDMATVAASALPVIFADWKRFYQIVDRAGIRVLRDPFTSKPNVLFYTTKRVGGDVLTYEAGKILAIHS